MTSSLAAACIHCCVFGVEEIFVAQRILWGAYVSPDPRTRVSDPTLISHFVFFSCCGLHFHSCVFQSKRFLGRRGPFFSVVVLILKELENPVIMGTNPKTTLYVGESFIFCLAFHSGWCTVDSHSFYVLFFLSVCLSFSLSLEEIFQCW